MRKKLQRFNEWVALHMTLVFGSMLTTYIFMFYGFMPLFFPSQEVNLLYWSNTIQLWSLPLLMVGTNLLNRSSERQNQRQYELVQRIDRMAGELHTMMETQSAVLSSLIDLGETSIAVLKQVEEKTQEIDTEVDAWRETVGNVPACIAHGEEKHGD